MATVKLAPIPADAMGPAGNENFPALVETAPASAIPVIRGLGFDAAGIEAAQAQLDSLLYGSGDLTVEVLWYADTATSGVVRWGASVSALTPNTDPADVETGLTWGTEATFDDTHLGTTGQRLHSAVITIPSANLQSLAAGDAVWLRIRRIADDAADTMTGDAVLTEVRVSYSDTP